VALKYPLAKTLGLGYVVSCAWGLQSQSLNGAVERNVRRECGILLKGG
jgi:hypothetical protein